MKETELPIDSEGFTPSEALTKKKLLKPSN